MKTLLENVFSNFHKLGLFAFVFFCASVTYFAKENIEPTYQAVFHYSFIVLSILAFFVLLFFNKVKPLFFILTLFVSYLVLNYLRSNYLLESPLYHNIGFFMLTNLCLSTLVPENKVMIKKNLIFLFVFFIELFFVEYLSKKGIFLPHNYIVYGIVCGLFMFFYSSIKNQILYYGMFFSFVSSALGCFFAFNTSGFSMFFGIGLIILCLSLVFYLYYAVLYNKTSDVKNKRAFLTYSQQKIIKCSMSIICIDDIKLLEEKFGRKNLNKLIFLTAQIIKEKHIKIYHIKRDDFVIVFENTDVDNAYEETENLRRQVATTDFVLKGYKDPIKLTISASVVEKKRSDANIFALFLRAQKDLLKRKNFNNNFTSRG